MKLPPIVLASAGAAALAAAIGSGVAAGLPSGPLQLLAILFFDASPSDKNAIVVAVIFGLLAAVRFGLALLLRRAKRSPVIAICAITALLFTVFAAAMDAINIYLASSRTGITKLAILAPGIGEALLTLAIGLLTSAAAFAANRHLMRQGRRKADEELQAVF